MDISRVLNDSFEYAKDTVWEKWVRWTLLLVSTIIFPLLFGYVLEVLRGKKPAPEPADWGRLFIDGLKLIVIGVIFFIIPIIICGFLAGGAIIALVLAIMSGHFLTAFASVVGALVLSAVIFIIFGLFAVLGIIRFARTGSMGEAFNFGAILAQGEKIGWVSYIFAVIVLAVILSIFTGILAVIPVVGQILLFILAPVIAIFKARYITLIYDSVPPLPQHPFFPHATRATKLHRACPCYNWASWL